jgi:hypothetical protein
MAVTANNKPAMIERRKRFALRKFGIQDLILAMARIKK